MARKRILDFMQSHRFWLFDVIPSLSPPFYVLGTPFLGFSSITAPEYTADVDEIKQVNSMFKKHTYSGGSVGSITLTRGVRGFDDTMWQWMHRALTGMEVTNKHLLLLHFTSIKALENPFPSPVEGISMPVEHGIFIPGKAYLLWDCLDEHTEVLTPGGWKGWSGISVGDMVYGMNMDSEEIELTQVDDYVCRHRGEDNMVSISGKRFNFRVTENHRFVLSRMTGKKADRRKALEAVMAGDLMKSKSKYRAPISGVCRSTCGGIELSDDEIRLIAWFVTDGHFKDSRLMISQAKEYKHEIRDLLVRLKLDFTERIVKPGGYEGGRPCYLFGIPRGVGSGRALNGWDKYEVYLDKDISPLLSKMTVEQFRVFWLELVKGNGTFLNMGELRNSQLYCSRKTQADAIQAMATIRGFAISIYERDTKNGHRMYCLCMRDDNWISVMPKAMFKNKDPLHTESSDLIFCTERVWCVSNKLGTIVTRRGGRVMIMGNCIPIRYKAASDFDAKSGEVSIAELEVQPMALSIFTLMDPI